MDWPVFTVTHETPEQRKDMGFMEKAKDTYDRFKYYRSEVIEAALFVESSLTNILLDFLSGADATRRALLREHLLNAEFCTFHQKWKLLRQLLKLYGASLKLPEQEMKTLRKELMQVISLRNRFAHCTIRVDARDFSVWIEYLEDGRQFEKVVEEELASTTDLCDRVHGQLWNIHKTIESLGYVLPQT